MKMRDGSQPAPRPYLTRERTNEILEVLDFNFQPNGQLRDYPEQRVRFGALQELIAGAIAEWTDEKPEVGEGPHGEEVPDDVLEAAWGDLNEELQEWAQEWLVG